MNRKNNINNQMEISLYEKIEYRIEKRQNNFDNFDHFKMDMLMNLLK